MGMFQKLNYVKQVYFTHRQVCEAEAVYRLSQYLHIKGSNVQQISSALDSHIITINIM